DTQIRFPAFLLTTHYWEGRWLMDMARIDDLQDEKKKKGAKGVTARWQRRMGNDSNLLIVFYVQIMPDDFVMQLHR
ncbi:hypothetical protein NQ254_26660, partial [Escherichia coli]|nr:hypothetical protein [Escherichia coli]MDW4672793.1 hypothetical protein [Escherichia coli]